MDTTQILNRFQKQGFTDKHRFDDVGNPYTLLINPKTIDKVRIYDSGRVLKTGANGKYERVEL